MSGIKTQPTDAPYSTLRECTASPMFVCEARPLTSPLAALLAAALGKIDAVEAAERQLAFDVLRAEANVLVIDADLDDLADAVIQNLLILTKKDTKAELYVHFMGEMEPNELKAPVLGDELDTLEAWLPDLLGSPHDALVALGKRLAPQVKKARLAEAALDTARRALASFREIGERPALVAEVNAARKSTHGDLAALVHQNPLAGLPADLAESSFRGDTQPRRATAKQLRAKLEGAQRRVTELASMVADAEAAEEARATKKAKREAAKKQKEIEKAEKRAAEAAAKLAALKSR
jgi:hypothetical protein